MGDVEQRWAPAQPDILLADIHRGELVFAAQPRIRDFLHLERDPAGLADIPFEFRVFAVQNRRLSIMAFTQSAVLQGENLLRVLTSARPTKGYNEQYISTTRQGRTGVLSDLQIFTPEGREARFFLQGGGRMSGQDIYERHFAHDPHFQEVAGNHAQRYIAAIEALGTENEPVFQKLLSGIVSSQAGQTAQLDGEHR